MCKLCNNQAKSLTHAPALGPWTPHPHWHSAKCPNESLKHHRNNVSRGLRASYRRKYEYREGNALLWGIYLYRHISLCILENIYTNIYHTGSGTSRRHISNVDKMKMKHCILILMYQWISRKNCFFNNFSKSVILISHYQMPFLKSGWFPGQMNWTGAGSCVFTQCSWSLKHISKLWYGKYTGFFMEYWSTNKKLTAWTC